MFLISCSNKGKTGGGNGETAEIGNFPPPVGDYKDSSLGSSYSGEDMSITKVSKVDENTTKIKGYSKSSNGAYGGFEFNISKWKKTTKDAKITKVEAVDPINANTDSMNENITIVYDYTSSTLSITFGSKNVVTGNTDKSLFNGVKQP